VGLSLLVAFCAGCGNVVLTNPIWVVATRMQAHQKSSAGGSDARSTPSNVAKEIYEESGIKVPRPSANSLLSFVFADVGNFGI